mgnify:CR=1 FL=1
MKKESAILLNDDPIVAAEKVKIVFTGGRPTAKEQREMGGMPEIYRFITGIVYSLKRMTGS